MKTEFKAKFLQHINKKRQDEGFTLIELLVVIIIIGILSAIALPSFLSQANKAKQTEAKQYISSVNKGMQAYYAENTKFTANVADLGLGLKTQTTNYKYEVADKGTDPNAGGGGTSAATPIVGGLKGYAGAVALTAPDPSGASGTQTILCETKEIVTVTPAITLQGSNTECGTNMTLVTK